VERAYLRLAGQLAELAGVDEHSRERASPGSALLGTTLLEGDSALAMQAEAR